MASGSESPPPTLIPEYFQYDVFLSYGSDTRNSFTDHLYQGLFRAGILTFRDDQELVRGESISSLLMRAIEESRISIVVFSQNYAASSWCLDELVKILECRKISGQRLIPVFYGVKPSDVRHQRGSYGEAFKKHEARYFSQLDKVNGWRAALAEAANISGFDLQSSALGSESRLVTLIVEEVLAQLNPKEPFVAKDPSGKSSSPPSSSTPPPSSSLPPSSIPEYLPYHVFLSFRGADTRNSFSGHLYDRLVLAGIRTFMDDDELYPGGDISQQLMTAIEESKMFIVVFSITYASSRWCLNELMKMLLECKKNRGRRLLPVFFGVKPSDVRRQKGSFEEAFIDHEARYFNQLDMVNRWRTALTEAANISGFNLQSSALGSESRLISLIVEEILDQVNPKELFVAEHPVGLDTRVNDVYPLLRLESNDHVRIIGIWGMGGSGKTVIAKALYNKFLRSFDSSCFLANVRGEVQQKSLVYLQDQLISELLRKKVTVGNVDRGIIFIRDMFYLKKVIIVLDDLDHLSQVNALAGDRWYGRGSVIIITTRDKHLLNRIQVDERHEAKELNPEESLELFSWHSFKLGFPQEAYAAIADRVVAYSCGLPLALVVLGSHLFGKTIQEWNSAYEKLQKIPPGDIQKILKISYDGLDDDEQRDIFLDIACFFIGMEIDYVTEILNGCDFSTEIGIRILMDRCLLTVNRNNELRVHDLLRDMGREIVREKFPREPEKRSRLWSHQDVTDVLMNKMGSEAIKGVTLVPPIEKKIHLNTKSFATMIKLRLLHMDNVNLGGSFKHLSEEIRWISWQDCSLKHLNYILQMKNLVALDIQHSKISTVWPGNQVNRTRLITNTFSWMSRLWQGNQFVGQLKILNLSHSKCLTTTPDFTRVPSLVTLILEGCTGLLHIDPSIGCLTSLLVLNLKDCEKITQLPSEVCNLTLLGYLNLSGCSNLQRLPHNLGNIVLLRELYADETPIMDMPYSSRLLVNLTRLSLRKCTKMSGFFSLSALPSNALRRLNLRDCNLSDEDIPDRLGRLSALEELDLAGNNLSKLPLSFGLLTNLQSLSLDNWNILQSMGELPPNLEALVTENI